MAHPAYPVPTPLDIELHGKNKNEEPHLNEAELSAHGTVMKDFRLELTKSGASKCGVCKEKIEMGEVRVGKKDNELDLNLFNHFRIIVNHERI